MTENQTTERDIPDDAGLTAYECPHHFDCDGIRCDPSVGDVPSSAPARVELETITDRAAIRDSDEPSERGDFPCCSGARAAGDTVGALDLDAIEGRARYALEWGDSANKEMILALVAEVRSLRAKVAAVEAKRDEFADLLARALPAVAALARVTRENEALRAALADIAQHGTRHDLHPTHRAGDEAFWHRYIDRMDETVRLFAEAALATGDGK